MRWEEGEMRGGWDERRMRWGQKFDCQNPHFLLNYTVFEFSSSIGVTVNYLDWHVWITYCCRQYATFQIFIKRIFQQKELVILHRNQMISQMYDIFYTSQQCTELVEEVYWSSADSKKHHYGYSVYLEVYLEGQFFRSCNLSSHTS